MQVSVSRYTEISMNLPGNQHIGTIGTYHDCEKTIMILIHSMHGHITAMHILCMMLTD